MAAQLRYQGIDCIVIEKTDGVVRDPKVSTVGYPSMEFCRRWGISENIRNAGWGMKFLKMWRCLLIKFEEFNNYQLPCS